MNNVSLTIACAALLGVAASSAASASTYQIGTVTEPSAQFGEPSNFKIAGSATPFADYIEFTLPYVEQLTVTSISATTAILVGGAHPEKNYQLTNGAIQLFSGVPTSGSTIGGALADVNAFGGITSQSYGGGLLPLILDAGPYYVKFTGTFNPQKWNGSSYITDNAARLSYDGTISVQAIPEASTWAMIVFGFFGLGVAGRYSVSRKPISIVA